MRRTRRRNGPAVLLAFAALAVFAVIHAAEWTVDDDGPADFRSIQAAIAAPFVTSGDTILVRPGTYAGTVYLSSKDLVIRSERGPFATILDAGGAGSVVSLVDRTGATRLQGFTITGGEDETGGGVWIAGGGPVVTQNVIQGNDAVGGFLGYGYGGGIEIYASAPTVTHNVIRGNSALDGGGGIDVYYSGPGSPGTCCPVIAQNTIVDNVVTSPAGKGGGILSFASEPKVSSSIVQGNRAAAGGGVYHYRAQGNHDAPDATGNLLFANVPDDADANDGWRLPGSNLHADPRLSQGDGIDLWPRSDSPAIDAAESGLPAGPDLWGSSGLIDSDLDGEARGEIGALENRAEITGLAVAKAAGDPETAVLTWDGSVNPAVVFNLYGSDGDPFRSDGGACLAAYLETTRHDDPDLVAGGTARFYLVTGEDLEEGSRGYRSDGSPRPASPSCSVP